MMHDLDEPASLILLLLLLLPLKNCGERQMILDLSSLLLYQWGHLLIPETRIVLSFGLVYTCICRFWLKVISNL